MILGEDVSLTTYQVSRRDGAVPYEIPRGRDLNGRIARHAREWRMRPLPQFMRIDRSAGTEYVPIPSSAIQCGDFVGVEARLDLVTTYDRDTGDREIRVEYAMDTVVRLYTARELLVSISHTTSMKNFSP